MSGHIHTSAFAHITLVAPADVLSLLTTRVSKTLFQRILGNKNGSLIWLRRSAVRTPCWSVMEILAVAQREEWVSNNLQKSYVLVVWWRFASRRDSPGRRAPRRNPS